MRIALGNIVERSEQGSMEVDRLGLEAINCVIAASPRCASQPNFSGHIEDEGQIGH